MNGTSGVLKSGRRAVSLEARRSKGIDSTQSDSTTRVKTSKESGISTHARCTTYIKVCSHTTYCTAPRQVPSSPRLVFQQGVHRFLAFTTWKNLRPSHTSKLCVLGGAIAHASIPALPRASSHTSLHFPPIRIM